LSNTIRRCSFAATIDEILDPLYDIVSGLGIPKTLVKFTNELVVEALEDCEITAEAPLRLQQRNEDAIPFAHDDDGDDEELHPVLWRISSLNMWQLLDRRIDEVYEMLWAVRRANERPHLDLAERVKLFKIQASRRAIRLPTADDYTEFARWVGRIPVDGSSWYPGIGQGFWTDDDFGDWERLNIFRGENDAEEKDVGQSIDVERREELPPTDPLVRPDVGLGRLRPLRTVGGVAMPMRMIGQLPPLQQPPSSSDRT